MSCSCEALFVGESCVPMPALEYRRGWEGTWLRERIEGAGESCFLLMRTPPLDITAF